MYHTSTQRKYWTFSNEAEIEDIRRKNHESFVESRLEECKESDPYQYFLKYEEERTLIRQLEYELEQFCDRFDPPMPSHVKATSFHYFKRFYLRKSAMDYHPREIMYSCIYLATKNEEFNISLSNFVMNMKTSSHSYWMMVVKNWEPEVIVAIGCHLTVYGPYRPLRGHLLALKVACPFVENDSRLEPLAEEFLLKTLYTDACLLFPPSQLAFAAIFYASQRLEMEIDPYLEKITDNDPTTMLKLHQTTDEILDIVANIPPPLPAKQIQQLEEKLQRCRNQDRNPQTDAYHRKLQKDLLDEDDIYDM